MPASVDVADELRAWRRRRRLSQLELALRAGTTQRHVSYLESGRSAPGRGMVLRLCEALEVPLRRRNALLTLAGHAPAYRDAPLGDAALAPVRAALERVLEGHMPYPAVVVDPAGDLVSANRAFGLLVAGSDPALLAPPVDVARLLLDPGGLAPRMRNFGQWSAHVLDRARDAAARNPDPRLSERVERLERLVPDEDRDDPGLAGFAVPLRLASDDGELLLLTTLSHFATTVDVALAELRLEAFLPGDEATARLLARAAAL